MSQTETTRAGRLNMRISARQEQLLRAAADLSGESVTGFVLAAATERAETVLERADRIEVSAGDFRRFVEALDKPPQSMPTLARYAKKRSSIPAK